MVNGLRLGHCPGRTNRHFTQRFQTLTTRFGCFTVIPRECAEFRRVRVNHAAVLVCITFWNRYQHIFALRNAGESGFMTGSVGLDGLCGGGQCAEGSSVTSHTTRVR